VLDRFATDGYQLVMAGHTHGGQLCLPIYGALVTKLGSGPVPRQGPVALGRQHAVACLRRDRHFAVCAAAVLLQTRSHLADIDCVADRRPRPAPRSRPIATNVFGTLSPAARVAIRSRPRGWTDNAIRLIEADAHRRADTHLLRYPLPLAWSDEAGVELYLKDETTHITGSLKHRLARSLFLYALCNGWIGEGTTVVEASSGSTAVSEAYFAALLGLPFIAVIARINQCIQSRVNRITRRPLPFRRKLE